MNFIATFETASTIDMEETRTYEYKPVDQLVFAATSCSTRRQHIRMRPTQRQRRSLRS